MGSGTTAAVLGGKSDGFGLPKKVLDKGRWSLATTSRPQSPAVRGFPGFWYRRRFFEIFKIKVVGRAKNPAFPSGCAVSVWNHYFSPLKVRTLRRYIKEKGREKSLPEEFLTF